MYKISREMASANPSGKTNIIAKRLKLRRLEEGGSVGKLAVTYEAYERIQRMVPSVLASNWIITISHLLLTVIGNKICSSGVL